MNKISALMVLSCFVFFPAIGANAEEPLDFQNIEAPLSVDDDGGGVRLKFIGERDEGAFEFFVKKDEAGYYNADNSADRLNSISPAAGIQFRLEF